MLHRQDVAVDADLHACQGIQQHLHAASINIYTHASATCQALSFIYAYALDFHQQRQHMHARWAARVPCQHFPSVQT